MEPEIYRLVKLHLYCLSRDYDSELVRRYPRTFADPNPGTTLWHFDPDIAKDLLMGVHDSSLNHMLVKDVIPTQIAHEFFLTRSKNSWNAAQYVYRKLNARYPELDMRLRAAHRELNMN